MAARGGPRRRSILSVADGVAIMVGIVVGIGIFKTPPLVAANVDSELAFIGVWVAGGFVTLIGALCYAELASAHPHAGGEYHFLARAYGRPVAILFGWARGTVIQTGAIAAVAFVVGDYASQVMPLGPYGSGLYAALSVVILTALNVLGTRQSKTAQNALTAVTLAAVVAIILVGLLGRPAPPPEITPPEATAALGMAMIFVLLTYGGWSEAVYLSSELHDAPRNMSRVLLIGTAILVALYVMVNAALLSILGLEGLRRSEAVAADLMRTTTSEAGALAFSLVVVAAALSTLNATIFTGARVYYAMARDLSLLSRVGRWSDRGQTPANGLILQGVVALALIALGMATRNGFQAMVDYTAPVFWAFLFLVGLSLMILRRREPHRALPFRVPFYPLTPILFCLTCLFMLHASLAYTGVGALIGLAVIAAGVPLLLFRRRDESVAPAE
ncbi:amino acid/polyamine/organocation transporter (APC superfamily) [Stella humosa]|uniref:Amino acid/polyamine/organocation transporter (APC superfamily) n=1 Tax=Stella humosa TaxID=94 RepID=A0A3N1KZI5_9PROT|nr:amino acid permease [Stella humosa]ROP84199.1 amino acid/polyamine/organocation transporter (APC superfamily) [Stella humosa]BBK33711.1 amino acid transporter [Stella humosa]